MVEKNNWETTDCLVDHGYLCDYLAVTQENRCSIHEEVTKHVKGAIHSSVDENLFFTLGFQWSWAVWENNLHVTWRGHVRVDTTVSSVGSSSHFRRSVDLYVGDIQLLNVQTLEVGVCLGIAKEVQKILGRLGWPSTLSPLVVLTLGFSSNTTIVASKWNYLLLSDDILQELLSPPQRQASDCLSCLTRILLGLGRFGSSLRRI